MLTSFTWSVNKNMVMWFNLLISFLFFTGHHAQDLGLHRAIFLPWRLIEGEQCLGYLSVLIDHFWAMSSSETMWKYRLELEPRLCWTPWLLFSAFSLFISFNSELGEAAAVCWLNCASMPEVVFFCVKSVSWREGSLLGDLMAYRIIHSLKEIEVRSGVLVAWF